MCQFDSVCPSLKKCVGAHLCKNIRSTQAAELERCGPFEFAAAVNVALLKGGAPQAPLDALLDGVRPLLGPVLGSYLAAGSGAAFRPPPVVETAVGPPAKSFPLHMVHSGRCDRKRVTMGIRGISQGSVTTPCRLNIICIRSRDLHGSMLQVSSATYKHYTNVEYVTSSCHKTSSERHSSVSFLTNMAPCA